MGTNGAGTALVLGRPFQVSGQEHYCRKHHRWTCSGAPILDPSGNTIGVLDMSGPVNETHLHTLGLVMAAVEAIQHEFELDRKNQELTLLNNRLASIILTVTDGVVVLDVQGRLCPDQSGGGTAAGRFQPAGRGPACRPGGPGGPRGPRPARSRQGVHGPGTRSEIQPRPGHCLASGKPILDE